MNISLHQDDSTDLDPARGRIFGDVTNGGTKVQYYFEGSISREFSCGDACVMWSSYPFILPMPTKPPSLCRCVYRDILIYAKALERIIVGDDTIGFALDKFLVFGHRYPLIAPSWGVERNSDCGLAGP